MKKLNLDLCQAIGNKQQLAAQVSDVSGTSDNNNLDDSGVLMQAFKKQNNSFTSSDNNKQVVKPTKQRENAVISASSQTKKTSQLKSPPKYLLPWWGWLFVLLLVIFSATATFFFAFIQNFKREVIAFQFQVNTTAALAKEAFSLLKTQNLPATKEKLLEVKSNLGQTKALYANLESGAKMLGYGSYYQDGLKALTLADEGMELADKVILLIEPYSEMLGFNQDEQNQGTAEDRVKKILAALQVVGPEIDSLIADLEKMQTELAGINANAYPDTVAGFFGAKLVLKRMGKADLLAKPVRSKIVNAQQNFTQMVATLKEYRPLIDQLPAMMGGQGQRRKYLILFQNNNELRPTGGFLTAYSIVYVEDGKVTPEKSDDIYELDKKFGKKITIPAELGRYLTTEKYWHLRDMNINPDFKASMETFLQNYQTVKGEPQDIDGIIAIDTKVLTDLVEVLGPIQVEGYGQFSVEPDKKYQAPQIVVALSEIITRPTPYLRQDRKGILGPMMKAILERTYGAGKETIPKLFELMIANIAQRHVQAYFLDNNLQQAGEKINLAGRMGALNDGSDFLAIVDANLGGAKSNLFIDYSVKQTILPPEDGVITKQVTIDYKNSRPGDNCNLEAGLLCLNAVNNDWNRIYLPLGSKLVSAKGYKGEPQVYDDKEKQLTVIDGFFSLNPNSNAKIDLTYTLPYTQHNDYQLKIWQQGGLRGVKHLLDVNGNQEEIIVDRDTNYHASFN